MKRLILISSLLLAGLSGISQELESLLSNLVQANQQEALLLETTYQLYEQGLRGGLSEEKRAMVYYQDDLHYISIDSTITITQEDQSLMIFHEDQIAMLQPAPPVSWSMLKAFAIDSMGTSCCTLINLSQRSEGDVYEIELLEDPSYSRLDLQVSESYQLQQMILYAKNSPEVMKIIITYLPLPNRSQIRTQYSLTAFLRSKGKNASLISAYQHYEFYNQFQP